MSWKPKKPLSYYGYGIEKLFPSGYFQAYVGGRFWKADSIDGIKSIIRENMILDGSACLNFGWAKYRPDGLPEPRQSIRVPARKVLLWWQEKSLSFTGSGYGARIPSELQVFWAGKWRRVYICNFGNSGTAYIGPAKNWLAMVDFPEFP